jgi:hypothetical protein
VGLGCVGKGLDAPEPRAPALEARRAEDSEGDPNAAGGRIADREGQVIEQYRAALGPGTRPVGLEDDRREGLDPVPHELAVAGHARLAGLGVGPQSPRPLPRHQRRPAVARPGSGGLKRLRDPPRDELVAASGARPLVQAHRPLAGLAPVMPGLLAWQQLGEAMRPLAVGRNAAVELATVARLAVLAVEAHPRAGVLGARARRPRFAPCPSPRRHPSPT